MYAIDPGRLSTRSVTAGAVLIVGSALAFALDGPMAQAAYRQGLDPAAFGFWRALAGAVVLGGFLATRPRPGGLAGIRRMRRAAVIRLALAAGLGVLAAVTRPATVLAPGTDLRLTVLLLLEGALAGAAAPLLFLAGLRRIGATQTAVLSLSEPLAATVLAAVVLSQLPAPSQLLGAGLLVGAGVAVQLVPRRAPSPGRIGVSLGSIAEAATAEMKVKSCRRTGSGSSAPCVAWVTRRRPRRRNGSSPIRFPPTSSSSSPTGSTSPATR